MNLSVSVVVKYIFISVLVLLYLYVLNLDDRKFFFIVPDLFKNESKKRDPI